MIEINKLHFTVWIILTIIGALLWIVANNILGAFILGMASGLGVSSLIIQEQKQKEKDVSNE